MRKSTVLITFVVFLLFVGGGIVAVLALATSTGLAMGGTTVVTGTSTSTAVYQAQAGWIRNNSPWEVEVTSVSVNDTGAVESPTIYVTDSKSTEEPVEGEAPVWAATPVSLPFTLPGGELRYFGFGITPEAGQIATFDTITVEFTGPLGFTFTSDYTGNALAISGENFPNDLIAGDPATDETSLDSYLGSLTSSMLSGDIAVIVQAMGGDVTEDQGNAFIGSQQAYRAGMPFVTSMVDDNPRVRTVQFYATDVATDGLPPITLEWDAYRWHVTSWG